MQAVLAHVHSFRLHNSIYLMCDAHSFLEAFCNTCGCTIFVTQHHTCRTLVFSCTIIGYELSTINSCVCVIVLRTFPRVSWGWCTFINYELNQWISVYVHVVGVTNNTYSKSWVSERYAFRAFVTWRQSVYALRVFVCQRHPTHVIFGLGSLKS